MTVLEVILLIIGAAIFTLSFIIPEKAGKATPAITKLVETEVEKAVSAEMDAVKSRVDDVVEESVGYAMEKTERALERISTEKIMAVSEYSDTVLDEIHKNHTEVMFLYDMLNDKHANIQTTVSAVEQSVKEAETTMREVETTVREAQSAAQEVAAGSAETASPVPAGISTKPVAAGEDRTDTVAEPAAGKRGASSGKASGEGAEGAEVTKKPAAKKTTRKKKNATEEGFIALSPTKISDGEGTVKVLRSNATEGTEPDISFTMAGQSGNNNEKILALHKAGKSNVAIAKELGLGVGEVKLVIDLFEGI